MSSRAAPVELTRDRRPGQDNAFLDTALRHIRESRPPLPASEPWFAIPEQVRGGRMVRVWFATAGCTWDRSGTCSMCNYGHGLTRTPNDIVSSVRDALQSAGSPITTLFLGPSGSLFDRQEVPAEVRTQIYGLVAASGAEHFTTESRPELVSAAVVDELAHSLPNVRVAVGLGLESASPWVQRFCVNKGAQVSRYQDAAQILRSRGVATHMNVCLGTAFLSTKEAIEDAEASVRWALAHGADLAVLFPVHVRPHTLLAELASLNLYEPPSLWSLIEVLKRLGPELCRRVQISWYRSYYDVEGKILALPTTCDRCRDLVLTLLDRYRDVCSYDTVTQLDEMSCNCKLTWRAAVSAVPREPLQARVLAAYEEVAIALRLQSHWRSLSDATVVAMHETALDAPA